MNHLDTFSMPTHSRGDYGIRDPIGAWPDASDEIVLWVTARGGVVVQTGYSAGSPDVLWSRRQTAGGGPWGEWERNTAIVPPPDQAGIVGVQANFADGAAVIELPAYHRLTVNAMIGPAAAIEAGGLRFNRNAAATIECRMTVQHGWGRYVVFGFGYNGGAPVEGSRIQCNSNEPVMALDRRNFTMTAGALLNFYISSDFPYQQFQWAGGEIVIIIQAGQTSETETHERLQREEKHHG